jgi:hypothetical protein
MDSVLTEQEALVRPDLGRTIMKEAFILAAGLSGTAFHFDSPLVMKSNEGDHE